jgi:hypothetical protein
MRSDRSVPIRCFFAAWIFGWVIAIYLPSAVVALTGLSPVGAGRSIPSAIFAVADEVAPAAKLLFAGLFGGLVLAARKFSPVQGSPVIVLNMVLALAAMLLVVALLPPEWSRGFGIGLTGKRFALDATLIYAAGGLLSGLVFSLSEARCAARVAKAAQ